MGIRGPYFTAVTVFMPIVYDEDVVSVIPTQEKKYEWPSSWLFSLSIKLLSKVTMVRNISELEVVPTQLRV